MSGKEKNNFLFPAASSPQRLTASSANAGSSNLLKPRAKIALQPGRSLMDWIRLGRSGQDLTGVGGKVLNVSHKELAKHNKLDDAWCAIRGECFELLSLFLSLSHFLSLCVTL